MAGITQACSGCGDEFGWTLWKYRCAACGAIVCGTCSPTYVRLADFFDDRGRRTSSFNAGSAVEQRACNHCVEAVRVAAARKAKAREIALARRAQSATRSLRRALLTPQVNPGSFYRCGKRT